MNLTLNELTLDFCPKHFFYILQPAFDNYRISYVLVYHSFRLKEEKITLFMRKYNGISIQKDYKFSLLIKDQHTRYPSTVYSGKKIDRNHHSKTMFIDPNVQTPSISLK